MSLRHNFFPKSVFITGGNRGIGLGLVRNLCELPKPPEHVFATCRDVETAKDLKALTELYKIVHIIKLDVTDYASLPDVVTEVEKVVGDEGLSLLINNAGQMNMEDASLTDVTPEHMRTEFEINTIAPVQLTRHMLPLLKKAAEHSQINGMSCCKSAVINMSSRMGSIEDNTSGSGYPYRISKAGLNMASKSMAVDLKKDNVLVAVLHPGWVQTDLGGAKAPITVDESIQGLLDVMEGLDENWSGTFWHSNGQQLSW